LTEKPRRIGALVYAHSEDAPTHLPIAVPLSYTASAAVLDERLRQHLRLGIRREEDALARLCGVVCGGASCKR
jgi:hypothetical protein